MKSYGFKKATEFTKKQINVIYALNKQGILIVPQNKLRDFYDLADYYGYDDNNMVGFREGFIIMIINAAFAKDYEKAQELIDNYNF